MNAIRWATGWRGVEALGQLALVPVNRLLEELDFLAASGCGPLCC